MRMEKQTVEMVAGQMTLAARTAPKAKGVDVIIVHVARGKEKKSARKAYDPVR